MAWLLVATAVVPPRMLLLLEGLFTDRLAASLGSLPVAVVGFVFLPATTAVYALAYQPGAGVTGLGPLLVVAAALYDLWSYLSGGGRAGAPRRLSRQLFVVSDGLAEPGRGRS